MLLACLYISVSAQSNSLFTIVSETQQATTNFRVPDKKKIEEYKKDNRFNYKQVERSASLWDKIKYWFWDLISDILSVAARSGIPSFVVVIIITLVLCLIIMKVAGVNYRTILGKKEIDTPAIDIYTENVHEMDFDTLIANAIKNKDFRLAIRFMYLKNLKLLSDKEVIEWNPNKTNYSYQYEIRSSSLRSKFLEATLIFDYIWYGEFPLNEPNFTEAYSRLNDFNKMIGNER
jgi:hypothetical protein